MKKISMSFAIICMMLFTSILTACGNSVKIVLSTENNVTVLKPGESTQIIMDFEEKDIVLAIIDGEEYATLSSDGVLKIKDKAVAGETVTTVAKLNDEVVSNELKITIGSIPLTGLTATANKTEIAPGAFATLTYSATPTNSNETINWVLVSGDNVASIEGNKLFVNDNATAGTQIKVKAQANSMSSNELIFTVASIVVDEDITFYAQENITADFGASTASVLTVNVWTNGQEDNTRTIEFDHVSGEDLVDLDVSGYSCTLTVKGHGTAVVRATVAGTNKSQDITINCIKAPEQIVAPESLLGRNEISTAKTIINNFAFDAQGTNVCQDMTYQFKKYVGNDYVTTDEVTLNANGLTFTETGKFKVIATSNSGSVREVSKELVFNVNEGVNVATFEEFRTVLRDANYDGKPVNIINLTKTGNTDSYDLIPSVILNGTENENSHLNDIRIEIIDKNVNINGNGFRINLSGMKFFASADDYGAFIKINNDASPYKIEDEDTPQQQAEKKRDLSQADFAVNIRDLVLIGSSDVTGRSSTNNFDPEHPELSLNGDFNAPKSAFRRGIEVGGDDIMIAYQVNMDNITVTNFAVGLRISHAVSGSKVSNTRIDQCYANGIESNANEIVFENMSYGLCGATGIEITPDNCNTAGLNFNGNQTVTFAGTISYDEAMMGNTVYFKLFAKRFGSIPSIIKGAAAAALSEKDYDQATQNNILTNIVDTTDGEDTKFILLALIFEENNTSVVNYQMSGLDQNGVVRFGDLTGINTTNEYIILPLDLGGDNLGSALLYNMNCYNDWK